MIPPERQKKDSKESKKRKNWVYVQRKKILKSKEKYFVSVRPTVAYEMDEGRNLATLFPQDLLQEENNLQIRLVNFISHENSKLTQRIYHTNSQFVRTCLVVNWEQEEKEKAGASLVEIRANAFFGIWPELFGRFPRITHSFVTFFSTIPINSSKWRPLGQSRVCPRISKAHARYQIIRRINHQRHG